jgi:hypothetical protein
VASVTRTSLRTVGRVKPKGSASSVDSKSFDRRRTIQGMH